MKVTNIPNISRYRIFKNFSWTASLPEFGRYNLIFAPNGSGKTTLSNLFRYLEQKKNMPSADGDATFSFDGVHVSGNQFETHPLPNVRVFNRDTVKRSVFEEMLGEFPPVFYLGEDNVEKQKEIAQLRGQATALSEEMVKARTKADSAESTADTFCINSAKAIKNLLTASGSSYNNYDKASFKQMAEKMQKNSVSRELLARAQRNSLMQVKSSPAKSSIALLSEAIPNYALLRQRVTSILETTVTSQLLTDLVAEPAVASWVNEGLALHRDSSKCKFCDQLLSPLRLERLAAHFNDHFRSFQASLDVLIADIDNAKLMLSKNLPNRAEFYDDIAVEYDESSQSLTTALDDGKAILTALHGSVRIKKERPFEVLSLEYIFKQIAAGTIEDLAERFLRATEQELRDHFGGNALASCLKTIVKHNERAANHLKEVGIARRELERHEVAAALDDYIARKEYIEEANTELLGLQTSAKTVQEKISQLERAIRTHQRPAEELSKELAAYLGNNELIFDVKDTGYTIKRSGQSATNLSEGERTAIAFLYFLKSLNDTGFDLKHGIVVIDDPVSSLDANSLYCAFGYMKHNTIDAEQLFILTHNFTFFRLVKNWFNNMKHQRKEDIALRPARFYMIAIEHSASGREAKVATLDPLLHEYESEYQYLFKCVVETSLITTGNGDLARYYGASNVARRVMETFLSFKLPHMGEDLHAKLEAITFEPAKKARILRFLHVNSHAGQIDEPEHDISILSETPAVLKDLLALIKATDRVHYDGMCNRLDLPN